MSNSFIMGFRENLKEELSYKGMLVKELADKSGVPKGTIDHYLAEKSTEPIAVNAVKIAKVLNVSVEYLVTGQDSSLKKENLDLHRYREYSTFISQLDSLPENQKDLIKDMVSKMCEWKNN